ncbi:hypothetical protein [Ureaplasma ceti]
MTYNLTKLLGISQPQDGVVTLRDCVNKYVKLLGTYVPELIDELTAFSYQQKLYIFPDTSPELAESIKKLIIAGFLITHEFTGSPIVLVQMEDLLKNNKLCTPDVLFFLVTLLTNLLWRVNLHDWDKELAAINEKMTKVTELNPRYFDVNLFNLKNLEIGAQTLSRDFENSEEAFQVSLDAFRQTIIDSVSQDSDSANHEETDSEFDDQPKTTSDLTNN